MKTFIGFIIFCSFFIPQTVFAQDDPTLRQVHRVTCFKSGVNMNANVQVFNVKKRNLVEVDVVQPEQVPAEETNIIFDKSFAGQLITEPGMVKMIIWPYFGDVTNPDSTFYNVEEMTILAKHCITKTFKIQ